MNSICCHKYKGVDFYQILSSFEDILYKLIDSKNKTHFQIKLQDSIWQST